MAHLSRDKTIDAIEQATAIAAALLGLSKGDLQYLSTFDKAGGAFTVNIADMKLGRLISDMTIAADGADWTFNVTFASDCFDDAKMPMDSLIGVLDDDPLMDKAKARCADIIAGEYRSWRKNHEPLDMQDIVKIANEALVRLSIVLHLNFRFHGGRKEVAQKYASFLCTEKHIPDDPNVPLSDRYFPIEFKLIDYYAPIGSHDMDKRIGIAKLRGKSKKAVCILRIAKKLQSSFVFFVFDKWPNVYEEYAAKKF